MTTPIYRDGPDGHGMDHVFTLAARLLEKPVLAAVSSQALLRQIYRLQSRLITPQAQVADRYPPVPRTVWLETGSPPGNGVVIFLHGGGFTIGSRASHGSAAVRLAQAAGMACAFVNYRLAPEHPFPAAIDDVEAAIRAIARLYPGAPLALSGDSAGGALALSATHSLLASGGPRPCALALMSPVVEMGAQRPHHALPRDPLLPQAWLRRVMAAYVPEGTDGTDPRLSPIYGTYAGGPPVALHTARGEALEDDTHRIARHLADQGCAVEVTLYDKVTHSWQMHHGASATARHSLEALGAFIARA